jgi:hypothetical protein
MAMRVQPARAKPLATAAPIPAYCECLESFGRRKCYCTDRILQRRRSGPHQGIDLRMTSSLLIASGLAVAFPSDEIQIRVYYRHVGKLLFCENWTERRLHYLFKDMEVARHRLHASYLQLELLQLLQLFCPTVSPTKANAIHISERCGDFATYLFSP